MIVNSTPLRATEELAEADRILDELNKKHGDVFDK